MASTGNTSGAGIPPAKEMMSGWAVSFKVSRTTEESISSVRFANRISMQGPPFSNPPAAKGKAALVNQNGARPLMASVLAPFLC